MVGKVTVAMLERNLMRLYEQFHSPRAKLLESNLTVQETATTARLHWYTAAVVTAMFIMQLIKSK